MKINKYITSITLAITALIFVGCNSGAYNRSANRQAVIDEYSHEVWNVDGEKYEFIARKEDGSVWFVETNGATTDKLITAETLIFPPTK
jgi:uncharacterized protein YcfL